MSTDQTAAAPTDDQTMHTYRGTHLTPGTYDAPPDELADHPEGRYPLDDHEMDSDTRDMLTDVYGTVDVCGYAYEAGQVLRRVDPVAFRCAVVEHESAQLSDGLWSEVTHDGVIVGQEDASDQARAARGEVWCEDCEDFYAVDDPAGVWVNDDGTIVDLSGQHDAGAHCSRVLYPVRHADGSTDHRWTVRQNAACSPPRWVVHFFGEWQAARSDLGEVVAFARQAAAERLPQTSTDEGES